MPRFLKHPFFWIAVLLLAGGGGGFFAFQQVTGKARAAAASPSAAPESRYITVANGKVDVEGGIIPVAARRGGIVREVLVQEGDLVTRGQILARQEDDEARLAQARSEAQLNQVRAQLAATEVQIAAARRELERERQLDEKGFSSGMRMDRAADEVRRLEAGLEAQRASIAVAEAAVREAAYNVELAVIRAPVDGRIIRRYANPGAGASTLNVSTMFDIEPAAPRIVRAEVGEKAIHRVEVGHRIEIVPENDDSVTYSGVVLRRAALFGARRLSSDNPNERLDDRVVEVVVSAGDAPLLVGQRVLVRFLKKGAETAEAR